MKKLSIKEKAKRYDEAIERAKSLIDFCSDSELKTLEHVFPELKESEDERIRKKLIEAVKGDMVVGGTKDKQLAIAWLEKQGEQIPANSVKTCKDEQKPIPKFEVGDVMRTLQEAADNITSGLPIVVSIDDEFYLCNNELIAIKDQDDYEYPPMNRIQKPAWSEEEQQNIDSIIAALTYCNENGVSDCFVDPDVLIVWLKSLRPQKQWKPSEDQITVLHDVAAYFDNSICPIQKDILVNLYLQLNKLREE